ncbi:hypothetical protein [Flavobacterium anhuiense]|uniref:Uncharacterized protein n=1 Tax=Flavobacterium anhuiense TaxID=459526 RepID=A0ABY0L7H9_9FLAO|nr:hypothetical protein [Flavobacterium anhuiense]SCX80379.1 hypothetical protein SAMN02927916_0376 [Flavobacterium anhuiense]
MRNNSQDSTLERNYLEKYRFLIKEYEQVKNKTHPVHKKANRNDKSVTEISDFYNFDEGEIFASNSAMRIQSLLSFL